MQKFLMCRPTHFQVSYEINPWMVSNMGQVDASLALDQWNTLFDAISKYAIVYLIDFEQQCPDMVFTANGGFISGSTAVVSTFNTNERRAEEPIFKKYFESKSYGTTSISSYYEGEGDHLIDSRNRHWLAHGFRTSIQAKDEIESLLNVSINSIELTDPRWYHLDTCFCPLPNGEIMWYPGAFSESSRNLIRSSFSKSIEVSESDALLFSCNCVTIGDNLFLPIGSAVSKVLHKRGYRVHEFELGEFMKSGGAAKCLVLCLEK